MQLMPSASHIHSSFYASRRLLPQPASCNQQRKISPSGAPKTLVIFPITKTVNLCTARRCHVCCLCSEKADVEEEELERDNEFQRDTDIQQSLGVTVALALLNFYRREISPILPGSCRYVPSCSEYSMQAYQKYGVMKGTILTAWRLMRCNPFGASGFDPPRWFGESRPPYS